ncbi:MAG TPA: ABC transporter permease [Vicinamibacterales bacterium]|nr:ABC transporter permease [Vicinamibacterales bacterium]
MAGTLTERLGDVVLDALASAGAYFLFAGRALVGLVRPPFEVREVLRQVYVLGWRSAPLILTSGFAVGVVLSMHTRATLERFGAIALIPTGLGVVMIRETGPLVAGLLVAGRAGAGIGAELGAMRVTEQIDALEAIAVDAFKYLAVTRILACMLVLPILTTLMDFAGILGGFAAEAAATGMSWSLYLHRAFSLIGYADFVTATLKTIVFGFIIGSVAAYLGFNATRGTEGVGEASTRSVVAASILLILSDVVLVKLIFLLFPQIAS